MSISSTVKTIMPYLKTASGYVLHRLSSQAVEMNDGTTLEQKVTSLNNLISNKVDTSDVVNNCLTTETGFVLDARQGKALDDKITELNGKLNIINYTRDDYGLSSAWSTSVWNTYRKNGLIHISIDISAGTILPNTAYAINASPVEDVLPDGEYIFSAVACDQSFNNAVGAVAMMEENGLIYIRVPESRTYLLITGTYRPKN